MKMSEVSSLNCNNFSRLPYKLNKVLGKGAYGRVFKGQSENGEVVALKEVAIDSCGEGIPLSTLREISVLKKLQRHNLSHQLVKGVEFLHSNRIVHRDLKPANLLINTSGTKLKITDFGLSRIVGWSCPLSPEVVTIWYRSPEVLLRSSYFSPCDMWATGCIIAEMFNCEALFTANNDIEMLRKILKVIGLPSQEDWPYDGLIMRNQFKSPDYVNRLSSSVDTNNQNALNLIQSMLVFNPAKRINAIKALESPFFKETLNSVVDMYQPIVPHAKQNSLNGRYKPTTRSSRHSMYTSRACGSGSLPIHSGQNSYYSNENIRDSEYIMGRNAYEGGSQENRQPAAVISNYNHNLSRHFQQISEPLRVDVSMGVEAETLPPMKIMHNQYQRVTQIHPSQMQQLPPLDHLINTGPIPVQNDGQSNCIPVTNRVRRTARRRTVVGMEQARQLRQQNALLNNNLVTGNPGDPTYGLAGDLCAAVRDATYQHKTSMPTTTSSVRHREVAHNTAGGGNHNSSNNYGSTDCSPSKMLKKNYTQASIRDTFTRNVNVLGNPFDASMQQQQLVPQSSQPSVNAFYPTCTTAMNMAVFEGGQDPQLSMLPSHHQNVEAQHQSSLGVTTANGPWVQWRGNSQQPLLDLSVTDCASNSDTRTSVGEDTHAPWDHASSQVGFDQEEIANIRLP